MALFLIASASLAGAIGVRATTLPMHQVSDAAVLSEKLPRLLSDFQFFEDGPAQVPAYRVLPYRLNTPLYSDGAEKLRFVYVPLGEETSIGEDGLLQFPVGSALIKTFAFGAGEGRRLIETRVLLHRADGWLALPYLWNEEQTEARLAVAGARIDLTTPKGEAISYRVPNKNQCKECHGLDGAVTPIGPKARNLPAGWLDASFGLSHEEAGVMPLWEERQSASAEAAARAYLDVNCAHCHRPGATASNSGLDLRWEQDDPHALGIMKRPVAAGRGAGSHLYDVVPGKPGESILLHRMLSNDPGVAMPELGKATVDEEGTEAVRRWIEGLPES
nr:SO2930 family diheme c-type cytochrome [Qipengyuania polymorpha]